MEVEEILYSALSNQTLITNVVGSNIYSDIRDQNKDKNGIFYERVSTQFLTTMESYDPYGEKASFSVSCFETSRELSESLMKLIINELTLNEFMIIDKQYDYDDEREIHSTTLQVEYTKIN